MAAETKTRVWEHDRLLRLWAVAPKMYDAAVLSVSDHTVEDCGRETVLGNPGYPCVWHRLIVEVDRPSEGPTRPTKLIDGKVHTWQPNAEIDR